MHGPDKLVNYLGEAKRDSKLFQGAMCDECHKMKVIDKENGG
jgi:hypothetical protein